MNRLMALPLILLSTLAPESSRAPDRSLRRSDFSCPQPCRRLRRNHCGHQAWTSDRNVPHGVPVNQAKGW